jgi:hypothetical protein
MKLLTCGRLAVRTVISSTIATKHVNSFQVQRKLVSSSTSIETTRPSIAAIATSASHTPDESSTSGIQVSATTTTTRNRVLATCCGFPKDMLFGSSKVLDQGIQMGIIIHVILLRHIWR